MCRKAPTLGSTAPTALLLPQNFHGIPNSKATHQFRLTLRGADCILASSRPRRLDFRFRNNRVRLRFNDHLAQGRRTSQAMPGEHQQRAREGWLFACGRSQSPLHPSKRIGLREVLARSSGVLRSGSSCSHDDRCATARFPHAHRSRGYGHASTYSAATRCCLTPRSTGEPTAGHQARACGTPYIVTGPGLASCRCLPVSSNVRCHKE